METLFKYDDYKIYLRDRIDENQGFRGYQAQLATAAGCQRSFFSQVLRGDMNLSRDHGAELCQFWGLSLEESDYFLALIDLARAGSRALKQMTQTKLAKFKEEALNLSRKFEKKEITDAEARSTYYSSWYWSAIHILVAIPQYNSATAIAERLELPIDLVKNTLIELESFGLVKRSGNTWAVGNRDLHLGEASPLNEMNHTNWRSRAILNVQKKDKDSLHYTSVIAVSTKDSKRIHEILVESIVKSREIVLPSPEEELFCLTCSFFEV